MKKHCHSTMSGVLVSINMHPYSNTKTFLSMPNILPSHSLCKTLTSDHLRQCFPKCGAMDP